MSMTLSIHKQAKAHVPRARLQRLFQMITRAEAPRRKGNVNLVFVTDAAMRRLNRSFRGIDRTTDVLSFALDEADESDGTWGEVYISVPRARRQAEQFGCGRYVEYLRLACHGFLHLLGYDHDSSTTERKMAVREEYFRRRLNRNGR